MKSSIKEVVITSLVVLATTLLVVAIGYFYLPAGIALGSIALAIGGLAFDDLTDEERVYRTSPGLLPAVGLFFVAVIACLHMLGDLFSWIVSLIKTY